MITQQETEIEKIDKCCPFRKQKIVSSHTDPFTHEQSHEITELFCSCIGSNCVFAIKKRKKIFCSYNYQRWPQVGTIEKATMITEDYQ